MTVFHLIKYPLSIETNITDFEKYPTPFIEFWYKERDRVFDECSHMERSEDKIDIWDKAIRAGLEANVEKLKQFMIEYEGPL